MAFKTEGRSGSQNIETKYGGSPTERDERKAAFEKAQDKELLDLLHAMTDKEFSPPLPRKDPRTDYVPTGFAPWGVRYESWYDLQAGIADRQWVVDKVGKYIDDAIRTDYDEGYNLWGIQNKEFAQWATDDAIFGMKKLNPDKIENYRRILQNEQNHLLDSFKAARELPTSNLPKPWQVFSK